MALTLRYGDRARKGAILLDAAHPGWHDDIDTNTLDLASRKRCILGQVYGSYGRGCEALRCGTATWWKPWTWGNRVDPVEHGFNFPRDTASSIDWAHLKWSWVQEIEERRGGRSM